jgi:hypothetical protein
VFPYEALLTTGEAKAFTVKLFDAKGQFIREAKAGEVQWSMDQWRARRLTATMSRARRGGYVKAAVGAITGQACVWIPPLPWSPSRA